MLYWPINSQPSRLPKFMDKVSGDYWTCNNNGVATYGTVFVTCTFYDGQPLPCDSGSFDPTGKAPNGECSGKCPARLPASERGATSVDICMTLNTNLFVMSAALDRIVALNSDTNDYQLIREGEEVDNARRRRRLHGHRCALRLPPPTPLTSSTAHWTLEGCSK